MGLIDQQLFQIDVAEHTEDDDLEIGEAGLRIGYAPITSMSCVGEREQALFGGILRLKGAKMPAIMQHGYRCDAIHRGQAPR